MNRRNVLIALAASVTAIAGGSASSVHAFQWSLQPKNGRKSLLIGGAGAMVPLNKALAAEFMKGNPLVDVVIEKGGSLQGLIAARRGAIDLAAMTRDLSDAEDDISAHEFLIARGSVGIIVNRVSPIKGLSQKQIRSLLTGETTNWKMVGGPDAPVNVVSRMRGSTTRQFVEEVLLGGGDVASSAKELETARLLSESVAADPWAIGYIASKHSEGIADVATLIVDGITASRGTVLSGRYPYTHSFNLLIYGEQSGTRFDFIRYARSPAGQKIVEQQGLISVC